ncbi:MAG TPA: hypothetical protein VL357_02095 [Rariglobus sp.]|jgi:hypothetical protein|nr:hypothetical protein [Rariglobus sp.]
MATTAELSAKRSDRTEFRISSVSAIFYAITKELAFVGKAFDFFDTLALPKENENLFIHWRHDFDKVKVSLITGLSMPALRRSLLAYGLQWTILGKSRADWSNFLMTAFMRWLGQFFD